MRRAAPTEPTTFSPAPPPEVVRHAESKSSPDRDAAGCIGDSEAASKARRPRSVTAWVTVTHLRRVSPPYEGFAPSALSTRVAGVGHVRGLHAASGPRSD